MDFLQGLAGIIPKLLLERARDKRRQPGGMEYLAKEWEKDQRAKRGYEKFPAPEKQWLRDVAGVNSGDEFAKLLRNWREEKK